VSPVKDGRLLGSGLVLTTTLIVLTSTRLMVAVVYHALELVKPTDLLIVAASVLTVILACRSVDRSNSAIGQVLLVGAAAMFRVSVQFVDLRPGLVIAFAVVSAAALAVVISDVAARASGTFVAGGLVAGVTVDVLVRAAFMTLDPAAAGRTPAAVAIACLEVISLVLVARRWRQSEGFITFTTTSMLGAACGASLLLDVLLFQNVSLVSSAGRVSLAVAFIVVIASDAAALLVLGTRFFAQLHGVPALLAGFALSIVASQLPNARGPAVLFGIMAGGPLLAVLLGAACQPARGKRGMVSRGALAGLLTWPLLLVLQQVHYKNPLPVDDVVFVLMACTAVTIPTLRERPRISVGAIHMRAFAIVAAIITTVGVAVASALATVHPSSPVASSSSGVRVAEYNVDNAISTAGRIDPYSVAQTLEALHPDVAMLEEVPRGLGWSGGLDLAEWLSRRLGLAYVYAPMGDATVGNLILSRVPLDDARVEPVPRFGRQAARTALLIDAQFADASITLIQVHLQHGQSRAAADARIRQLNTALKTWSGQGHAVLAGDFNAGPETDEIRSAFTSGFTTAAALHPCVATTPRGACVDWIFVTPGLVQRTIDIRRIGASDHWPVVTNVSSTT
jgi:endonuclease/exonuclease/phosphatase family metal-dependent hydrolase